MEHILFVTGKLAEPALRKVLEEVAPEAGFEFSVDVLPITVAALANTSWVSRHLTIPANVDRIVLPGLCAGNLMHIQADIPIEKGPKDLRDLPEFFHTKKTKPEGYGKYDIEILAEINHAPRLSIPELVEQAHSAKDSGADLIDLGCNPGETWNAVGDAVAALVSEGMRVSIDSFNPQEVKNAVTAGAELTLSVNSSNRHLAPEWGCEVVAIPDNPANLQGLDETVQFLQDNKVPFRIDPIIEPIGFGFAASLGRYLEVRRRYPQAEMMMGIGNLTELTDVDSAGVNVILLGFCQEVGIRSVLTTEVINWCRSCVRELDLARRLVYHAVHRKVLPKHLEPNLIMLRDTKVHVHGRETLEKLASNIKDRNFRVFAEQGLLHILNRQLFHQGTDPFELFQRVLEEEDIAPDHAFYLGYEIAKAVTALTLGKDYIQDQPLNWGFLTLPETSHYDKMKRDAKESKPKGGPEIDPA